MMYEVSSNTANSQYVTDNLSVAKQFAHKLIALMQVIDARIDGKAQAQEWGEAETVYSLSKHDGKIYSTPQKGA